LAKVAASWREMRRCGEEAKDLAESAVHATGGGEIAAGGIEFGKIECGADDAASG